ncbi:hypothetical protein DAI22_02g033400 [Oryza sativa Japonica Group]|nr:hypothetical protein DAI22_02g033400 [Oryza sativa Japonica Group]
MWRLKVAESGGTPLLRSTNGFLGRAVWEFDPDHGTPEDRADVERVRREFTDHRLHHRESADLLMRMQQNKHQRRRYRIPPVNNKLGEKEEVTEEIAMASLRRALDEFSSLQADDGHWPGDFSGVMFIMPGLIFALYVTGSLDTIISPEHRREICRYIYNHQAYFFPYIWTTDHKIIIICSCIHGLIILIIEERVLLQYLQYECL